MLDSIQLALSGMEGFSGGLRTIAANTANLSTTGFKAQRAEFAEQFHVAGMLSGAPGNASQAGGGLELLPGITDWRQGELRKTGNDLDLAIDGAGLFVLRRPDGSLVYTRAGQFVLDAEGRLVTRTDGSAVLARTASGALEDIDISALRTSAAQATTTLNFQGNLSSGAPSQTVAPLNVTDANGTSHTLSLTLTSVADPRLGSAGTVDGQTWQLELKDELGNPLALAGDGLLRFFGTTVDPASARVAASFAPAGAAPRSLDLVFGSDVTNFAAGPSATLRAGSIDGRPARSPV